MAGPEFPRRRLLVLANKAAGLAPNQRFRFEQWAPHLASDHGISLELAAFESPELSKILYRPGHRLAKAVLVSRDFVRRFGIIARARNYDAILLVREASLIGPAIIERLVARTGTPIIFDYDDAIWSSAQLTSNGVFSRLHFFGKTDALCRVASAVTPGNEFLAAYARARNANIFVVPTSIELDNYPLIAEPASDRPFIVCWTGSTSTLAHFEFAREPLERLAAEIPLVVKIICNQPPDRPIQGAETRFVPWSQDNEAQEVGDCHVGIMPLPDNEATRGKCGLKALQYMATGRPVVVSPVGMNCDLIDDGRNGFLASDATQFVDRLMRLARSAPLRGAIGAEARRTIEDHYSASAVAARFASVVHFVLDDGPRPPEDSQPVVNR